MMLSRHRQALLLLAAAAAASASAQTIPALIDAESPASVALLERLVNLNSGTFHTAGVNAVADQLEPQFRALGFATRRLPMDSVKRAAHLVAERKGTRGLPLLLIGHMDTVFEPSSPFQRFERQAGGGDGTTIATGPGIADMKGGIVVMLLALKALHRSGQLDGANITVFLTADEEAPGDPIATTRGPLIEAGRRAKAALCFETGVQRAGRDYATTARRGFVGWTLKTTGIGGHSGRVFSKELGHGAIFEISRVINEFHSQLREPNMTFNVGQILGGAGIQSDDAGHASVNGKSNIVAAEALARGEVRALSPEQVARTKDKMYAIAARSLPGTKSELTFEQGYPPMAPTPGNRRLLALLNEASREAGLPELGELDPMERGAGDISFIAPYVDSLSGLGASGSGSHAPGESADLASIPRQAKRAALLIQKLTAATSR